MTLLIFLAPRKKVFHSREYQLIQLQDFKAVLYNILLLLLI